MADRATPNQRVPSSSLGRRTLSDLVFLVIERGSAVASSEPWTRRTVHSPGRFAHVPATAVRPRADSTCRDG